MSPTPSASPRRSICAVPSACLRQQRRRPPELAKTSPLEDKNPQAERPPGPAAPPNPNAQPADGPRSPHFAGVSSGRGLERALDQGASHAEHRIHRPPLRRRPGAAPRQPGRRARQGDLRARPQRRRQDQPAARHRRPAARIGRPHPVRGQAAHRLALYAGARRHRLRAAGPRDLSAAHRQGEPRDRLRPAAAQEPERARTRCSSSSPS